MEPAKHHEHLWALELQEEIISYGRCTKKSCCSGDIPGAHLSSMHPQLTHVGCADETEAENKLPQMALGYLGSWSGSILPLSMDHPLSLFLPAAIWQAPAHRGDSSLRLPVHPYLVLGTASAAWPGGVMVGLLAMPPLSIPAHCHFQVMTSAGQWHHLQGFPSS